MWGQLERRLEEEEEPPSPATVSCSLPRAGPPLRIPRGPPRWHCPQVQSSVPGLTITSFYPRQARGARHLSGATLLGQSQDPQLQASAGPPVGCISEDPGKEGLSWLSGRCLAGRRESPPPLTWIREAAGLRDPGGQDTDSLDRDVHGFFFTVPGTGGGGGGGTNTGQM